MLILFTTYKFSSSFAVPEYEFYLQTWDFNLIHKPKTSETG